MSDNHIPSTNGGRLVKRGDTFDPECHRTTYRLQLAREILREQGIAPAWEHSDSTYVEWGREKHACDYRCKATWPEWVTGRVFDLAYQLADEMQTERGSYHHQQIAAERAARYGTTTKEEL